MPFAVLNSLKSKSKIWLLAITLSLLVVLFGVFLVLHNLRLGLDWSDESWILSLTASNRIADGEPWVFQHLLQPIWHLSGESIVGMRYSRFAAYQLAVIFIAIAAFRFLESLKIYPSKSDKIVIFICTESAMLMAWTYWPRAFGYNELGSVVTGISISLIILLILQGRRAEKRKFTTSLNAVTLGILIVIASVNKLTTGLFLLAAAILMMVLVRSFDRLIVSLGLLTGFSLSLAFLFYFDFPISNLIESLTRMALDAEYAASYAHPPTLIKSNIEGLASQLISLATFSAVAGFLLQKTMQSKSEFNIDPPNIRVEKFGLISGLGLQFWSIYSQTDLHTRTANFAFTGMAFGFSVVLVTVFKIEVRLSSKENIVTWALLSLIVLAPFLSAFGSNNPLNLQATFNVGFWGALLGCGIVILKNRTNSRSRFPLQFSAAILVIFAILTFRGLSQDQAAPYRSLSYETQTTLVSHAGIYKDLLVDGPSAQVIAWLHQIGSAHSHSQVIAVASPGAILATGNEAFASPFMEGFWPGSFYTISNRCLVTKPDQLLVLVPANFNAESLEISLLQKSLLEGCQLDFPMDFITIGLSPANSSGVSFTAYIQKNIN